MLSITSGGWSEVSHSVSRGKTIKAEQNQQPVCYDGAAGPIVGGGPAPTLEQDCGGAGHVYTDRLWRQGISYPCEPHLDADPDKPIVKSLVRNPQGMTH